MGHGNLISVNGVRGLRSVRAKREMRDDLMSEEIEIDPVIGAPTFGASKEFAVKAARCTKVVNWECEVEWRQAHFVTIARQKGCCRGFR
jgi:hypothetical protein